MTNKLSIKVYDNTELVSNIIINKGNFQWTKSIESEIIKKVIYDSKVAFGNQIRVLVN
jgi:hypothetical protein